jgi:hypothetical protein
VSNAHLAERLLYGTSDGFTLVLSCSFSCGCVRFLKEAFPKIDVELSRGLKKGTIAG